MFKHSDRLRAALPLALVLALASLATVPLFARAVAHSLRSHRPKLEITGTWWTPQPLAYGVRSVSGRVANRGSSFLTDVHVTLELFDSAGTRLGTHLITLHDLPRGGSKEFCTWALPGRPTRYRVIGLSGS